MGRAGGVCTARDDPGGDPGKHRHRIQWTAMSAGEFRQEEPKTLGWRLGGQGAAVGVGVPEMLTPLTSVICASSPPSSTPSLTLVSPCRVHSTQNTTQQSIRNTE